MRAQEEIRNMVEKACNILQNTYIACHKQNACRNVNIRGISGEGSERNGELVIGNQRKDYLFYILPENLAELFHSLF